jgi:hypothetical protein
MRPTPWLLAESFRIQIPNYIVTAYGDNYGAFSIPFKYRHHLRCLVGPGDIALEDLGKKYAWDHVSVSLVDRCPTWDEMVYIKNIFFSPEEAVIQFHPPESEYVNRHPFTLHLWKPLLFEIPLPPKEMVG